jgi:ATP-dependent DNA helicase RecG
MNEIELQQYILDAYPRENTSIEWKAYGNLKNAVSGHEGDDIISYLSAIANMNGGVLIIGIEDLTAKYWELIIFMITHPRICLLELLAIVVI